MLMKVDAGESESSGAKSSSAIIGKLSKVYRRGMKHVGQTVL